ncbi:MAG: hypothetical protein LUF85_11700 [Bacteroides sp.]|nr:hypothetical protein [Bacteroides sp.]
MKKMITFLFGMFFFLSTFAANDVIPSARTEMTADGNCAITFNFTNANLGQGNYVSVYFNNEEIYRVENGVLQGSAIVSRTVSQGSKAELEFFIDLQDNPQEYGFFLYINNVWKATLWEQYNHTYIHSIDTSTTSATVNFYMLYEPR